MSLAMAGKQNWFERALDWFASLFSEKAAPHHARPAVSQIVPFPQPRTLEFAEVVIVRTARAAAPPKSPVVVIDRKLAARLSVVSKLNQPSGRIAHKPAALEKKGPRHAPAPTRIARKPAAPGGLAHARRPVVVAPIAKKPSAQIVDLKAVRAARSKPAPVKLAA